MAPARQEPGPDDLPQVQVAVLEHPSTRAVVKARWGHNSTRRASALELPNAYHKKLGMFAVPTEGGRDEGPGVFTTEPSHGRALDPRGSYHVGWLADRRAVDVLVTVLARCRVPAKQVPGLI